MPDDMGYGYGCDDKGCDFGAAFSVPDTGCGDVCGVSDSAPAHPCSPCAPSACAPCGSNANMNAGANYGMEGMNYMDDSSSHFHHLVAPPHPHPHPHPHHHHHDDKKAHKTGHQMMWVYGIGFLLAIFILSNRRQ